MLSSLVYNDLRIFSSFSVFAYEKIITVRDNTVTPVALRDCNLISQYMSLSFRKVAGRPFEGDTPNSHKIHSVNSNLSPVNTDPESVKPIDQSLFPPQESIIAGFIYPPAATHMPPKGVAARLDTAAALSLFCRTDCSSPICKSITSFLLLSIPLLSVSPLHFSGFLHRTFPAAESSAGFRRTSPETFLPCLAARQPCPQK